MRGEAFKLIGSAYGFAGVMAVLATIPVVNGFLYSGHGGVGWMILPFVFPYAAVRLAIAYRRASPERRAPTKRVALVSTAAYLPASLVVAYFGTVCIRRSFGLEVAPLHLWAMFTMPLGLPLMFI